MMRFAIDMELTAVISNEMWCIPLMGKIQVGYEINHFASVKLRMCVGLVLEGL